MIGGSSTSTHGNTVTSPGSAGERSHDPVRWPGGRPGGIKGGAGGALSGRGREDRSLFSGTDVGCMFRPRMSCPTGGGSEVPPPYGRGRELAGRVTSP